MRFNPDDTITLGTYQYFIKLKLGQGAITDAYQAIPLLDGESPSVVIKIPLSAEPDILKQVKHEIEALDILNRAEMPSRWTSLTDLPSRLKISRETARERLIIANLDSGLLDSGQPYIVQEFAPPMFERFDIRDRYDEIRMLTVIHALSRGMALAHQKGLALKDFEPQTKGDRIRVRWIDDAQTELEFKITDWNITGTNTDFPQDLFLFGRHVYYFMLGRHLSLDDEKPPLNLGLGIEDSWETLSEGSRQIVQRLLHRDPKRRYASAAELETEMNWWLTTLQQSSSNNAINRLQDRLWTARSQNKQDRVLAIANLALQLQPPEESREMFELWGRQARDELEKEIWIPIAQARAELGRGAFAAAVDEFQRVLPNLDSRSEAARLARYYLKLAAAGQILKEELKKEGIDDIRSTPLWADLNRANSALREGHWAEAEASILYAKNRHPVASACKPINDMHNLAMAGVMLRQAMAQLERHRPRLLGADRSDWPDLEQAHLNEVEKAIQELSQAQKLAPNEPEFADVQRREERLLQQRRQFLQKYQEADQFITQFIEEIEKGKIAESAEEWADAVTAYHQAISNLDEGLRCWREILEVEASQPRANALHHEYQNKLATLQSKLETTREKAQALQQTQEALTKARQSINNGRYDEARPYARRANSLSPDNDQTATTLAEMEMGLHLLQSARIQFETAEQNHAAGRLESAHKMVMGVKEQDRRPFAQLMSDLTPSQQKIAERLFILEVDLKEDLEKLLQTLNAEIELRQIIDDLQPQQEIDNIAEFLERKQEKDQALPLYLEKLLSEVKKRQRVFNLVDEVLSADAPSYEQVENAVKLIGADQGPKATKKLRQLAELWLRVAKNEPLETITDLKAVADRLKVGIDRFDNEEMRAAQMNVQQMLAISTNLVGEDREWPDDLPVEWKIDLNSLQTRLLRWAGRENGLLKFTALHGWTNLTNLANRWNERLIKYLVTLLQPPLEEARRLSSEEHNFVEAQKEARRIWDYIPVELQNLLPPDVGTKGLAQLLTALDRRLTADETFTSALNQLNRKNNLTPFADFLQKVESLDLIVHDKNVPTQDLSALAEYCRRGAKWEALVRQVTIESSAYAQLIDSILKASTDIQETIAIIKKDERLNDQLKPELDRGLKKLRRRLELRANEQYKLLVQELETTSEALRTKPDDNPESFLTLYRHARWAQLTYFRSKKAKEPDRVATATLEELWEQAINKFEQPEFLGERANRRSEDMVEAESILQTANALHRGLKNPSPLTNLPSTQSLAVTLPREQQTLDDFIALVSEFIRLANRDHENLQPASSDEQNPEAQRSTSNSIIGNGEKYKYRSRLVQDARTVSQNVEEALKTKPPETSLPGLEEELNRLQECAQALEDAFELHKAKRPMDGLTQHLVKLDSKYAGADEQWKWLLKPEQEAIRQGYKDLYDDLIHSFTSQLQMEVSKQQTAASKLEDFIKKASGAGLPVVEAAYEAIIRLLGINGQANAAQDLNGAYPATAQQPRDIDKATIRRYCRYVATATRPWVKIPYPLEGISSEIAEKWQRLYEQAQEQDRLLAGLSPEEIKKRRLISMVIGSPILLVLVLIISFLGYQRPRQIEATATAEYIVLQAATTRESENINATGIANAENLEKTRVVEIAAATREAEILMTQVAEKAKDQETLLNTQQNIQATSSAKIRLTQQANEIKVAATATAAAIEAEQEQECINLNNYNFEISEPTYKPVPVSTYVWGDSPAPAMTATWIITNNGPCPMVQLRVLRIGSSFEPFQPQLLRESDNVPIESLESEETARLVIDFSQSFKRDPDAYAGRINREWIIIVQNLSDPTQNFELTQRKHPSLRVKIDSGWINVITPTPTLTPTPTPTPTPVPPPPPITGGPSCPAEQPTEPCRPPSIFICRDGNWICEDP